MLKLSEKFKIKENYCRKLESGFFLYEFLFQVYVCFEVQVKQENIIFVLKINIRRLDLSFLSLRSQRRKKLDFIIL